jgi:hypothetical protein
MLAIPEPHILLTFNDRTELLRPAPKMDWRAGDCPSPATRTHPMMTASTLSLTFSVTFRTTTLPNAVEGNDFNLPFDLPNGVLNAETITIGSTSFSLKKLIDNSQVTHLKKLGRINVKTTTTLP